MPILVEQVCKKIVKSFPNWLNMHATAYKQCSWPSRLQITVHQVEMWAFSVHANSGNIKLTVTANG